MGLWEPNFASRLHMATSKELFEQLKALLQFTVLGITKKTRKLGEEASGISRQKPFFLVKPGTVQGGTCGR